MLEGERLTQAPDWDTSRKKQLYPDELNTAYGARIIRELASDAALSAQQLLALLPLTLVFAEAPGEPGKGDEQPTTPGAASKEGKNGEIRQTLVEIPTPEVKEAQKILELASKLTPQQKERVEDLQQTLLTTLPNLKLRIGNEDFKKLMAAVQDEQKGVVKDSSGKEVKQLGHPYYGPATQEAFKVYLGFLEEESIPALFTEIAQAKGELPAGGSIKLSNYKEGPFKGKSEAPEILLAKAANGNIKCKLDINPEEPPTVETIEKIRAARQWSENSKVSMEYVALQKMQEIARRTIARNGFPKEWTVETASQCAAVMYVLKASKETTRLIESIDLLKKEIGGSNESIRKWAEMTKPENLPRGVTVEREGGKPDGKITAIKFDFPKELNLQSADFRKMLREMHQWCARMGEPVDQLMGENAAFAKDPKNIYAWMDLESPHGWIKMGKGQNGEPSHQFTRSKTKPEGDGWHHFNLIEMRCGTENKYNRSTGDLEAIKITGTMNYCDVPFWSYSNLYKPKAEGTDTFTAKDSWREPGEWVAIRDTATSMKFMQAKDVQDYADMQAFLHWTDKGVTAAMDVSILFGVGAIGAGARAERVAANGFKIEHELAAAAKLPGVADTAKLMDLVKLHPISAQEGLAAAGRSSRIHGWQQAALGLTAPTNNVYAAETPGLRELDIARKAAFGLIITKGTVYDPLKNGIRRLTIGPKAATFGEQLYATTHATAPAWIKGLESAGHYGFAATQVPFALEMQRHLRHQIRDYLNMDEPDLLAAAQKRLDSSKRAGNGAMTSEEAIKEHKLTVETIGKNLEDLTKSLSLDGDQLKRAQEILATMKPLLEPPLDKEGRIDQSQLAAWKEKRQELIEKHLVPILLPSPDQIRQAEVNRAGGLDEKSLRDKKTFTADEVYDMGLTGKLNPQDKRLRDFAAAALICLSRGADGKLECFGKPGEKAGEQILYSRQVNIPKWSVEKAIPGGKSDKTITISVPKDGTTRDPMLQQIKMSDLVIQLEAILASKEPAGKRIATGELLVRAGLPGEVYAATLKDVIGSSSATAEQKREALVRLAGVAFALKQNEAYREQNFSGEDKFAMSGLSCGNSSREIRDFIHNLSKDSSGDLDSRALARYLVTKLDRIALDEQDKEDFEKVLNNKGQLTYKDFLTMMSDAVNKKPQTIPDYERKLQAALALSEFCDANGKLIATEGFKMELPDLSRLNVSIAEVAMQAKLSAEKFSEQISEAEKRVIATEKLLEKAKGTAEEAALKERFEKEKRALEFVEDQRILSIELSIKAAEQLVKPVLRDGRLLPRLMHMDQSPLESEAAVSSRESLYGLLKTSSPSIFDVNAKARLIKLMPEILADYNYSSPPAQASFLKERLPNMRKEFSLGMQSLLLNDLDLPPGLSAAKRLFPNAVFAYQEGGYRSLWALAKNWPELKVSAIGALTALNDRSAYAVVKDRILPEKESDPAVRLAAARAITRLAAGGNEQAGPFIQDLLNRGSDDPSHPPETDPAVVLALDRKFDAVGFGESPEELVYKKAAEQVQAYIQQGKVSRGDIGRLLETDDYKWLNPRLLRENLKTAKENTYSWFGSYLLDGMPLFPGTPTPEIPVNNEMAAQKKVLEEYKQKFDALTKAAFEDNGQKGADARKILFWLITSDGKEWNPTEVDDKEQKKAGYTNANIMVDRKTFEKFQLMAAASLADCCRRLDSGKPLPDQQLAQLEMLLYAGLKDPNAPTIAKWYLMQGVESIAKRQTDPNRGEMITARGTTVVLSVLQDMLAQDPPKNMDEKAANYEMACRRAVALKMLDYVGAHLTSKKELSTLEGIALVPPGVTPVNDKVPYVVRQKAREIISDKRDRVFPAYAATRPDNSGNVTPRSRKQLLEEAKAAARLYINDGTTTTAGGEVPKESLTALQARQDDMAVRKIFSATKGFRITSADDPVGQILMDLLSTRSSDRVREAAAMALIYSSNLPSQRKEAVAVLSELAVTSKLYGVRRDAENMLKILAPGDYPAAVEALVRIKVKLLSQMKEELQKAGQAPKDDEEKNLIDTYIKVGKDDSKKMQLAVTLSNLSRAQSAQDDKFGASANALAAINIFRGEPIEKELEKFQSGSGQYLDSDKLVLALKKQYAASEYLPAVANAVEAYGKAQLQAGDVLPLYDIAQKLRIECLGKTNRDFIAGISTCIEGAMKMFKEMRNELDDLREEQRKQETSIKRLDLDLKQTNDPAQRGEIEAQKKDLESDLALTKKERKEKLDKLAEALRIFPYYLDYCLPHITEAYGKSSVKRADILETRASLLDQQVKTRKELLELSTDQVKRGELEKSISYDEKDLERRYRELIDLRSKHNAPTEQVVSLYRKLAELLWRQERFTDCKKELDAAAALYPGTDKWRAIDIQQAIAIQADIACLSLKLKNETDVTRAMQRINEINTKVYGDRSIEFASGLGLQAQIRVAAKQYDLAATAAQAEADLYASLKKPKLEAAAQNRLANIYLAAGNNPEMLKAHTRSFKLILQIEPESEFAIVQTAELARWQAVSDNSAEALKVITDYKNTLEQKNMTSDIYIDRVQDKLIEFANMHRGQERERILAVAKELAPKPAKGP